MLYLGPEKVGEMVLDSREGKSPDMEFFSPVIRERLTARHFSAAHAALLLGDNPAGHHPLGGTCRRRWAQPFSDGAPLCPPHGTDAARISGTADSRGPAVNPQNHPHRLTAQITPTAKTATTVPENRAGEIFPITAPSKMASSPRSSASLTVTKLSPPKCGQQSHLRDRAPFRADPSAWRPVPYVWQAARRAQAPSIQRLAFHTSSRLKESKMPVLLIFRGSYRQ